MKFARKRFNTTAVCIPEKHYMVDISDNLDKIIELIEDDKYFTINRSRQFGKSTTLFLLDRRLSEKYFVFFISFEGLGEESFSSNRSFVLQFIKLVSREMEYKKVPGDIIGEWKCMDELEEEGDPLDFLSNKITILCQNCGKEILLLIDEVDKSSDNQIFLNFLGLLRNKYLARSYGRDETFKSVILAGVYDVKNLKIKLRSDEEKKFNSPWNIAVDFTIDMSFLPEDIATMLEAYESDHHTGMDIDEISKELYFFTGGYPFLVSWLCKWIDEQGEGNWTRENIRKAEKSLQLSGCTLLDDVSKNYENNQELQKMIDQMLFCGKKYSYTMNDPVIRMGSILGILKEKNGQVAISNIIFEKMLSDIVFSKIERSGMIEIPEKSQFVSDGKLDMVKILNKFQNLMKTEYRKEDGKFIEQQGRLLFLCFLKPIINGTGFYYVEPETRNNSRMDIVVTYGREEFIIELKIWHGEEYRQEGIRQLEGYLDARNATKGYLISFSFLKNKEYKSGWVDETEIAHKIYEVVV